MPKLKTHSSAKKRFIVKKSGSVKYKKPKTSHMMMNKPKSMKRKAKNPTTMLDMDAKKVVDNYMRNEGVRKRRANPSPAESAALKAAKKETAKKTAKPAKAAKGAN